MKTLRLLLFEECNRNCSGCCNKDWDLNSLKKAHGFKRYNEILLTGGEPMLYPLYVVNIISMLKKKSKAKIYMYMAKINKIFDILLVLSNLDGITLTLHDQKDVEYFLKLNNILLLMQNEIKSKSLKLNVFANVLISIIDLSLWKVKLGIKWIKNCPLPNNEVFKRL